MAIVYKVTNKINGKCYVGQTTRTLEQRWESHLSSVRQGSNYRFHNAIRKYGVDNWHLEILFEHPDVTVVKKKEEEFIEIIGCYRSNKIGYNAKPGGCGGWVVFDKNYEKWKKNISISSTGLKNGNCTGYTNEDLIKIGVRICRRKGRILGHASLTEECKKEGIKFPSDFSKMRFDGDYKIYVGILEKELCMTYDPYFRSVEQREKLSKANIGKKSAYKGSKVVIDRITGKRRHVKN